MVRRVAVIALAAAVLGCSACSSGAGVTAGPETRAAVPGPSLAPPGPATVRLTATDEAWLDAVERLEPRLAAVLDDGPHAMTATALRGLAGDLGACSRELATLGTPSPWVAPVADLAREACREYDKGAACFADAAGARSASGVQHDLDCGFAAATRGGRPLAEAGRLGQELRASR